MASLVVSLTYTPDRNAAIGGQEKKIIFTISLNNKQKSLVP
jgi:hypothetical protein